MHKLIDNSFSSLYSLFSEAVFDIHNCLRVTIHNNTFTNNYGTGIIFESFRGNTGCVSITYNQMDTTINPIVLVTNSTFINNSAVAEGNIKTDRVYAQFIFRARGGGLAVFVQQDDFNVTAEVRGCIFYKNMAAAYAGGVYILFRGNASHRSLIEETIFESNMARLGGGGMILVGLGRYYVGRNLFDVRKCKFIDNESNIGAGIYEFVNLGGGKRNILSIEDCQFFGNHFTTNTAESFGAAIAVDFEEDFAKKESSVPNTITNW